MILHPIIDLLKRIVIALPDYAGGDGTNNLAQIVGIDANAEIVYYTGE